MGNLDERPGTADYTSNGHVRSGRADLFGPRPDRSQSDHPWQLFYALKCQRLWNATLAEILLSRGWISQSDLLTVLSVQITAQRVDLQREPPDEKLAQALLPDFCLKHCVLPWAQVGGLYILATGRPDRIPEIRRALPPALRGALIVTAPEQQVHDHIATFHRKYLTRFAESRVSAKHSCRGWDKRAPYKTFLLLCLFATFVLTVYAAPDVVLGVLMIWALLSLCVALAMKTTAFALQLWHRGDPPIPDLPPNTRL
ncbi:MAG: hypothetical protein ABJR08_09495, partial [Roseobacter sp.]